MMRSLPQQHLECMIVQLAWSGLLTGIGGGSILSMCQMDLASFPCLYTTVSFWHSVAVAHMWIMGLCCLFRTPCRCLAGLPHTFAMSFSSHCSAQSAMGNAQSRLASSHVSKGKFWRVALTSNINSLYTSRVPDVILHVSFPIAPSDTSRRRAHAATCATMAHRSCSFSLISQSVVTASLPMKMDNDRLVTQQ